MQRIVKLLAQKRFAILVVISLALYAAISIHKFSLWYVVAAGIFLGLIFGKVFCRWMCPMGLIMELLMNASGSAKARQMYQYHKIGCPIAWASGLLNRISIFKIRLNNENCRNCGICDRGCYIVSLNPAVYSLHRSELKNPATTYTCSRCLNCISVCPSGSLEYRP